MSSVFEDDPKGRKRRFLQGLNAILRLNYRYSGKKDTLLRSVVNRPRYIEIPELRKRLKDIYCLDFTESELEGLLESNMTTGEFTEEYCKVIYESRGSVDFNALLGRLGKKGRGTLELAFRELDKVPKYGKNGPEWCDVAEGKCSCGASH